MSWNPSEHEADIEAQKATSVDDAARHFEGWLVAGGKSVKSARNYRLAVQGKLNEWALNNGVIAKPLLSFVGDRAFGRVARELRALPIFIERNTKGKGMYGAALRWLHEYLLEHDDGVTAEQLANLEQDSSMLPTEKQSLRSARLGQGRFRSQLVSLWGECACTGYRQTSLLVASHIKPWALSNNRERLDVYNGLLLTPNIDKAFDRNYISFAGDGSLLVSSEFNAYEQLGITLDLKVALKPAHQPYMAFHREACFRG